jgi:hypothetical protein
MGKRLRFLAVSAITLALISVSAPQPVQAVSPVTVPTFTVTRGSNPFLARLNFTADSRARYVVHAYFSGDNFLNKYLVNSDYVPGTDASNISPASGNCSAAINDLQNTDPYAPYPVSYCRLTGIFSQTVRFSLLVIERSNQNRLPESAKSEPVGFLQGASGGIQRYGTRSDGTPGVTIATGSTNGASRIIVGFRRSDDYSVISAYSSQLTMKSGSHGFAVPLAGGYRYTFDVKYFGGVSGNTTWFDSDFKSEMSSPLYVSQVSAPVSDVIATPTADGKIHVRWTNPTNGNLPARHLVYLSTNKFDVFVAPESLVSYPTNSVILSQITNGTSYESLTPGVSYFIVVSSTMASPDTNPARVSTSEPVIVQMAPGSPLATFAAADRQINATWTEPQFTGGVSPKNYEIQASSDGTNWTFATFDGSARNGSIGSLTNGQQYTVRIRAINDAGPGTWESSTATPIGVPTAVTEPVTSIGQTTARIAMSLNAQGDNVRVWLQYRLGDGTINEVDLGSTNSSIYAGASSLTGLTSGRLYRVRAKAQASDGNYYYGLWKNFTTTPLAVTNVAVSSTAETVTATWATPDVTPTVLKYDVWAEVNGETVGMGCTDVSRSSSSGSCVIAGLDPGVLYDIRIAARVTGGDFGNATSQLTRNALATKRLQVIQDRSGLLPKLYVGIPNPNLTSFFSADSGLALSITSTTGTKCLVEPGLKLSVRATGTCSLTIAQSGNTIFGPAETKTVSLTIAATQTISFSFSGLSAPKVAAAAIDIASYASASSSLAVSFSSNTNETCTIDGTMLTPQRAGLCEVFAIQTGNENFMSAPQESASFFVGKGDQATLEITSTGGQFNQPLTLLTSGGSGTGNVTYTISSSGNTSSCSITSTGVKAMQPGDCIVQAKKEADDNYIEWVSQLKTLVFTKASQAITFVSIPDTIEGSTINPSVSSSSELTVTLESLTTSVCTISNGSISLDHAGTCRIKASQSGTTSYLAASDVTVQFESNQKATPQTGTMRYDRTRTYRIGSIIDFYVADDVNGAQSEVPGTFTWLADTPGILEFDPQVHGRATVVGRPSSGGMLNVMYKFTPSAGYTALYNPALGPGALQIAQTPQPVAVAQQIVDYDESAKFVVSGVLGTGQLSYGFSPMDNANLNSSARNALCTISGTIVTRSEPGSCVVRALVASDNQYEATAAVQEFFFMKKSQYVTVENYWMLDEANYANQSTTFDLSTMVVSSQGLTVDTSTTSAACSITASVLTVLSAGECSIKMSQAGSSTVIEFPDAYFVFMIGKAPQSAVSLGTTSTTFGVPLSLTASGGDGSGGLSFSASDGSAVGCRVVNGALLSNSAGTCLVETTKAESENFATLVSSPEVVTIDKASHTMSFSFSSLPTVRMGDAPFSIASFLQLSSGRLAATSSGSTDVCTIVGTVVTVRSTGQCIIDAEYAEDVSFTSISTVTRYFTVQGASTNTVPSVVNTIAPVNTVAPVSTVAPVVNVSEPRNVLLSRGGSKSLVVSWQVPTSGQSTITTYVATLSPGGKRCSVSTTTCTFTGLNAAQPYRVSVVAVSATMTSQAGTSGGVTPNIQIKVKGKTNLSTMITAPSKGAQKWSVKGGCKISGQMFLAATKPSTCTLTLVTAKNKTMPKSTLKVSIQIKK